MDLTNCKVCSSPLPPRVRSAGRAKEFCSDKCRTRFYYRPSNTCVRCKGPKDGVSREHFCTTCAAEAEVFMSSGRYMLRKRLSKYGLSLEQGEALMASQDDRCAICRGPIEWGRGYFGAHVDHDHACCEGDKSCGSCVRGLLCPTCNVGLGSFRDDAAWLRSAADYLTKAQGD